MTGEGAEALRRRITLACLASAPLFVVSIWVPEPLRYVLWAIAIVVESNAMLAEDRAAADRARRERDFSALGPSDPAEALDAHHFAERFGLFLIVTPAGRGRGGGRPDLGGRARRQLRRLGGAGGGDAARGRAVVAVLRLRGHQPPGARAVGRVADDGARDLRRRARRRRSRWRADRDVRARAARPRAAPLPLGCWRAWRSCGPCVEHAPADYDARRRARSRAPTAARPSPRARRARASCSPRR